MSRTGLRKQLRYRLDNFMARGTVAQIIGLAAITFALTALFALLFWTFDLDPKIKGGSYSIWVSFWSLLRPSTPAWTPESTGFMVAKVFMLLFGMFVASMLISILSSGFRNLVLELREGRSHIPVSGHTLILGWSPTLMSILPELIVANESEARAHIVILAQGSKQKMDDELTKRLRRRMTTEVVARSGDPYNSADLDMVNINGARSVIVLTSETSPNPDIEVIKTLMAIAGDTGRTKGANHVVAAIRDPKNIKVATLAGKGDAEVIPAMEIISKITAQTCRQPGLPLVYTELMAFEGAEMYLVDAKGWDNATFGEVLFAYSTSCPMGLWTAEDKLIINPPANQHIRDNDRLLILAEDDSTIVRDNVTPDIDESVITDGTVGVLQPETMVIVGWNAGARVIVRELDLYVEKGSELIVLVANEDDEKLANKAGSILVNQRFQCRIGNATDREVLDELGIENANHVILLKYDDMSADESDSNVLVTLLHVRDIIAHGGTGASVVSELSLERNRLIAHADRADDFVVGDYIIGLLYAQISQQKAMNRVFVDLLSEEGSEIYLKPAELYVELGKPVSFFTVLESAKRKHEVAIGYRISASKGDAKNRYGVKLNPDKQKQVTFRQGDRIVVLAEDYSVRRRSMRPGPL